MFSKETSTYLVLWQPNGLFTLVKLEVYHFGYVMYVVFGYRLYMLLYKHVNYPSCVIHLNIALRVCILSSSLPKILSS